MKMKKKGETEEAKAKKAKKDEAKKDADVLQHPVTETLMSEWGDNNFDIESEDAALDMAPLSLAASATAARVFAPPATFGRPPAAIGDFKTPTIAQL